MGQDPYINEGQAHGLCFSVEKGELPPSLKNIFKELSNELGCYVPNNGNLTKWARQGVLLLNSVLTVERGKSFSHKNKGWEQFTKKIIEKLANKQTPIVFMLWGSSARKLKKLLHNPSHLILECVHPSPLAANHGGWFKNNHFRLANEYLKKNKTKPIDWVR